MQRQIPLLLALALAGLAPLTSAAAPAASTSTAVDWPQIRGPHRDGVSPEGGLLRTWPESGPQQVWKRPLGEGFSGVSVAGGRLYTMAAYGATEYALCLDAATGEEVWRTPIGETFVEDFGNGPRSTPTVEAGVVYVLSGRGTLHALKAADGAKVWEVDLPKTFGSQMPLRGFAPSPLIDGDLLLLEAGGAPDKGLVAFDKRTGQTRWTVSGAPASYSSAIAVTIDGVKQYVFVRRAGPEILSVLPDGKLYWTHPGPPTAITMPVFVPPDKIFVSAGDDIGSVLLKVADEGGKGKVEEVWRNRLMKNHFNGSVLVGDHLYGFDNGTFKCVSVATGEQTWAYRGLGKGSVVAADGLLFVLSDRGTLVLVEATPTAYTERGRVQALEGKTWTAPTLAGGRLYLRDHDEIACLDVKGEGASARSAS